jgi:hypothetical protein
VVQVLSLQGSPLELRTTSDKLITLVICTAAARSIKFNVPRTVIRVQVPSWHRNVPHLPAPPRTGLLGRSVAALQAVGEGSGTGRSVAWMGLVGRPTLPYAAKLSQRTAKYAVRSLVWATLGR